MREIEKEKVGDELNEGWWHRKKEEEEVKGRMRWRSMILMFCLSVAVVIVE